MKYSVLCKLLHLSIQNFEQSFQMSILATDTHYFEDKAQCVAVVFDWSDTLPKTVYKTTIEHIAPYEPGQFYKRELPCIMAVLEQVDLSCIEAIIVDGHVYTSDDGKPGLGAHLFRAINDSIPIIGVAKSFFRNNAQLTREVLRSESKKPLYVSAVGTPLDEVVNRIKNMPGCYRMPDMLKHLDQLTRETNK